MTAPVPDADMRRPALSLVLCARNDRYMGDPVWRLATALEYAATQVHALDRESDVEILVTDWGSQVPLAHGMRLTALASRLVSFLTVPPDVAHRLERDSPFAEVLALNAAIRRARGEYIGRIDQDTLVGRRFLETFFALREGRRQLRVPLASALLFSGRRDIPYRLAARRPPFWVVDRFVEQHRARIPVEHADLPVPFYQKGVGIWLLHRSVWHECRGYDERMIYMNSMEINMVHRLATKYEPVDLGALVDHDFYHLEHYHPWRARRASTHRKVNPREFWHPETMTPNDESWGLADFSMAPAPPASAARDRSRANGVPALSGSRFRAVMLFVGAQQAFDAAILFCGVWRCRGSRAWQALQERPFHAWPQLLRALWGSRSVRVARRRTSSVDRERCDIPMGDR